VSDIPNEAHETAGSANAGHIPDARRVADNAKYARDKIVSAIADATDGVRAHGSKARTELAHQVEQQPIASVLAAASFGLIAGVLLARR